VNIGDQKISDFLESLASKEPTPGGGATSGLLAALATSLGNMVLAYTHGKVKYADHQSLHGDCKNFLHAARDESLALATADAKAYGTLNDLWKLEKEDPLRLEGWDDAVKQATAVPIRTIELCNHILTTLETMLGKTNKMLDSDLVTASILAKSSAEIAAVTARINLPLISDHERTSELEKTIQSLIASCETIARSIDEACGAV